MDASRGVEIEGHLNIAILPKRFYDTAVSLGVVRIELNFSGGSDEGYRDIELIDREGNSPGGLAYNKLVEAVDAWADDYYSYSGAGDGMPYGDSVIYDFVNCRVIVNSWFSVHSNSEYGELSDDDDFDSEESYERESAGSLCIPLILAP